MSRPNNHNSLSEAINVRVFPSLRLFLERETEEKALLVEEYSISDHIRGILTRYKKEKEMVEK